ncbi:GNAT family N-acetyltransferase [Staphylococcus succinus]|uniref:GNAT family N-acetyltransferase n=1 Tax=Staphylococcus succinus TaxID=61015 RepID=A0A9Q6MU07_9STAP|nr:GNAT family N-acetyltransferase [Staphylococcus succinus]MEB8126022.1 GNAT family N-acetyltransferase [Staphylococcus succinus]MEB8211184.1 GNAT family N-acetyltransferase [Staphylococcus succinus]PTI42785.1 GNAT family N-acetyltransferase [Staphylococcus succinus]PTI73553.1 GNAT family N-acetyltransferase [Staphylococcus succinus]PTJ20909.1 GNAT family N-acetyltransferase [Staphylococcus succinus]
MTHIRYLTIDDLSIYYTFLLQGIHKEHEVYAWKLQNEKCLTKTNIKGLLSEHNDNYTVIGIFEQNELIGAVTLIHDNTYDISHKAVMENMCVKGNDHSSKERIAKLLMHYIFQICHEKEIEILMTSLVSNNISGKVFFSNLNFETLGLEHHARKYDNYYVDEHWLIYYFNGNDFEIFD